MNAIIACVLSVQLALAGCQTTQTSEPGLDRNVIEVQGMERSYRFFRPRSIDASEAVPVLFVFHGGGGDAKQAREHFGFHDIAREHEFMVVYPEAVNGHWNDGRGGEKFASQDAKIDDVEYFRSVMDHVKSTFAVDEDRVHAMGVSNGGMFVQRLALEETQTFAAVASTISSLPEPLEESFHPKAKISVLFMSGTADPIVPFEGGEVVVHLFGGNKKRRWEESRGRVLPVTEAASLWVTHNQIQGHEQITLLADSDADDESRVRKHLWQAENRGGPAVVLYEVINGGHTLPRLGPSTPRRVVGRTNHDIDAQDVIWQFFSHKKRQPMTAPAK